MLLERETELNRLTALLDDVPVAGGRIVLIRGEAGIGKSALVQEFRATVSGDLQWHLGYCDDLLTPQPFAPLWDLASDAPELGVALHRQDRQQVFGALFGLLDAPRSRGVVVLEDTHWSDEATLDAIRYVGRRIARSKGLLVLTYRTGEVGEDHPMRSVVGGFPSDLVVRIEPGPLSRTAVTQIVAGLGLNPDDVMNATQGNPFLVNEMAVVGANVVPSSVRDSVMARVERLTAASRGMVKTLAVIPGHVSTDEVSRISGASIDELAECERMELLAISAGRVAFRHDLIRRAIDETLTTSDKIASHRKALDGLAADSDPARLVHHAAGAGDVDRLVPLALTAARSASAVSSNREAAAHYRSLEPYLSLLPAVTVAHVLLEWAEIEHYLESPDSAKLADRALMSFRTTSDRSGLAQALVVAVDIKRGRGRFDEARSHADEAIGILDAEEPSRNLALALAAKSWLLIHRGAIVEAESLARRAIGVAEMTSSPRAELEARGVVGVLAYVRGQPGGLDSLEAVRGRARELGLHVEEVSTLVRIGRVAIEIRDLARAADYGEQARATAARHELLALETEGILIVSEAKLGSGDWAVVEDLAVDVMGKSPVADIRFERLLGVIGARLGRSDAERHLRISWDLAEKSGEIDHLLESGAGSLEWMWIHDRVDSEFVERCRALVRRGVDEEYPWPAGWLAFWVWLTGMSTDVPTGLPAPWLELFSGHIAAAARFWELRGYPYEQALCLSTGDTAQRLTAVEVLGEMGADAVASKLRRDLRLAGISVPRGRSRSTRTHRAGLTARQAEVLSLLADDLTNSEIADSLFLSTRTVENHVSAVLSKLGASSRVEAVEEGLRQGLIPTKR